MEHARTRPGHIKPTKLGPVKKRNPGTRTIIELRAVVLGAYYKTAAWQIQYLFTLIY